MQYARAYTTTAKPAGIRFVGNFDDCSEECVHIDEVRKYDSYEDAHSEKEPGEFIVRIWQEYDENLSADLNDKVFCWEEEQNV